MNCKKISGPLLGLLVVSFFSFSLAFLSVASDCPQVKPAKKKCDSTLSDIPCPDTHDVDLCKKSRAVWQNNIQITSTGNKPHETNIQSAIKSPTTVAYCLSGRNCFYDTLMSKCVQVGGTLATGETVIVEIIDCDKM